MDRDNRETFFDASEQPGENTSGSELDEEFDFLVVDEVTNGLGPSHGTGDLSREGVADVVFGGDGFCGDVGDHRQSGRVDCGPREDGRKFVGGGGHQARVIGAGDVERFEKTDAFLFGLGGSGCEAVFWSAEDDLSGRVVVCDIDVAVSSEGFDDGVFCADGGRHAAFGFVAGGLHEGSTL